MQRAPLPPALSQLLAQTRRQLRWKHRLNAWVASVCGLSLTLLLGFLAHAATVPPLWLGLLEVLGGAAVLVFCVYFWGWRGRRATAQEVELAAWIDRHTDEQSPNLSFQSAVELSRDRGLYPESEALTEHVIEYAAAQSTQVDSKTLVANHNWPLLRRLLSGASLTFLSISILGTVWPQHLRGAIAAVKSIERITEDLGPQTPRLRLDDFTITYRSPSYTERPTRTVRSGNGKVRALPGTELVIETSAGQPLQSATLVIGLGLKGELEEQRTAARVNPQNKHNKIIASFIVSRAGRYKFEARGKNDTIYVEGQSHEIELEPDLPPRVTMSKPIDESLEVNLKDLVEIHFKAHDDFGLGDVSIAWRILGSSREGHQLLSSAGNGKKELRDEGVFDLSKLKLQPGDRIAYSVEAQDNDTVNGPKIGAGATRELRVYSERQHHREVLALQEKALDELIHVLGDNLEKPYGTDLKAKELKTLLDTANAILKRARSTNTLLVDVVTAVHKDPLGRKEVATAFEKTRRDLSRDTRQKTVSINETERQYNRSQSASKSQLKMNLRAQERMIRSLEKNVVYLADLLNDQRMLDAEDLTKSLREQQEALRTALEEYRSAPAI